LSVRRFHRVLANAARGDVFLDFFPEGTIEENRYQQREDIFLGSFDQKSGPVAMVLKP